MIGLRVESAGQLSVSCRVVDRGGTSQQSAAPRPNASQGTELGKVCRRRIAEPAVRPDAVLVFHPLRERRSRMRERDKPGLVQERVAETTIEAFDEGVLRLLVACDVVSLDVGLLGPTQYRHASESGAVIGNTHDRPATLHDGGSSSRRPAARKATCRRRDTSIRGWNHRPQRRS